jgi:hypothetical protein
MIYYAYEHLCGKKVPSSEISVQLLSEGIDISTHDISKYFKSIVSNDNFVGLYWNFHQISKEIYKKKKVYDSTINLEEYRLKSLPIPHETYYWSWECVNLHDNIGYWARIHYLIPYDLFEENRFIDMLETFYQETMHHNGILPREDFDKWNSR